MSNCKRETKGSGDKELPVLDSRTSGLHVCSRDVSLYCMGESWRLLLPLEISLFQTASQKNSNKLKNLMSPEPFVSRAKALPAKKSEKGYGARMASNLPDLIFCYLVTSFQAIPFLLELRSVLDWVCTDTTLTLYHWLKMEDIYANIYVLKCYRESEKVRRLTLLLEVMVDIFGYYPFFNRNSAVLYLKSANLNGSPTVDYSLI